MKTQHQKTFLTTVVVALAASALMGVVAIFIDLGDTGSKMLVTTLLVAVTGMLSLAGATAAAHGSGLGRPGMVAACLALPLTLMLIWAEWNAEWLIKGAGCLGVASTAFAHSGLLSLARLGKFQWVTFGYPRRGRVAGGVRRRADNQRLPCRRRAVQDHRGWRRVRHLRHAGSPHTPPDDEHHG